MPDTMYSGLIRRFGRDWTIHTMVRASTLNRNGSNKTTGVTPVCWFAFCILGKGIVQVWPVPVKNEHTPLTVLKLFVEHDSSQNYQDAVFVGNIPALEYADLFHPKEPEQ